MAWKWSSSTTISSFNTPKFAVSLLHGKFGYLSLLRPVLLNVLLFHCSSAHAKASLYQGSGIAWYLGEDNTFDRAMTDFGVRYADVNERDYEEFFQAVNSGRIQAITGV